MSVLELVRHVDDFLLLFALMYIGITIAAGKIALSP